MLSSGCKTRLYARYSRLLYFPLFVLPDRPLQSTLEPWSPGGGDPRCRPPQHEDFRCLIRHRVSPLTRSSLEVPRQEASPFQSVVICASLLKATLYSCVCTQILLLPLTLCSRAVVFKPWWPLSCIKQLVLFYL